MLPRRLADKENRNVVYHATVPERRVVKGATLVPATSHSNKSCPSMVLPTYLTPLHVSACGPGRRLVEEVLFDRLLDLPWCFRPFCRWRRRRWRVRVFVEDGIALDFAQPAALSNSIDS
jgi:hypothetical protein